MSTYDTPESVFDDALTLGEDHLIPPAYTTAPLAGAQNAIGGFAVDVGKGVAKDVSDIVALPARVSAPNPHPAGSEEADYYNAVNANKVQEWIPQVVSLMAGGGTARALSGAGKNTLGMIGGRMSARADQAAFREAEELFRKGASREKIDEVTGGLWRQPDAKWRYEIPDTNARIINSRGSTLGQVMEHPEWYDAYRNQRIDKIPIKYDAPAGEAYYMAPKNTKGKTDRITIGLPKDPMTHQELKELLLHEGGHIVQGIEGFTRGAHPQMLMREVVKQVAQKTGGRLPDPSLIEKIGNTWYLRTGGEAEARAISVRSRYSPEQLARESFQQTMEREYPANKLFWAKPGEVHAKPQLMSSKIMTERRVGDANSSVHSPEIQDFLNTISTSPR